MSVCYGEKRRYELPYTLWVPKINDTLFILVERRYELPQSGYPRANQDLSVCYGESGGTSCFNDDRVIGLRNLVTEREVIGQYDLIVERERYHSRNLVTERKFKIRAACPIPLLYPCYTIRIHPHL